MRLPRPPAVADPSFRHGEGGVEGGERHLYGTSRAHPARGRKLDLPPQGCCRQDPDMILVEEPMSTRLSTQMLPKALVFAAGACLFFGLRAHSQMVSSLFARGYNVIPEPQQAKLEHEDFRIGAGWRLELARGVEPSSTAIENLKEGLEDRHHRHCECASRIILRSGDPGADGQIHKRGPVVARR